MLEEVLVKQQEAYQQIRSDWEKIQLLEPRSRFKAMKSIGNAICGAAKEEGCTGEQLEFYIEVLRRVIRVHDSAYLNRNLTKIIAIWLEVTGNSEAAIIKKKAGQVPIRTSMAIADAAYDGELKQAYMPYDEKNLLELMNAGKALVFNAEVHDTVNVQVRVVDSLEPVLTVKEFKCVRAATETVLLEVPTGELAVANPWSLDEENFVVSIEPGQYKSCVYLFTIPNKLESYYIVLSRTAKEARNTLTRVSTLEN